LSAVLFRYRGVLVVLAILPATLLPGRDHGSLQLALVLLLLASGTALRIAGVRQIGSRARVHTAGARALLTGGIFGYLRNPLYLGNAFVAASLCALLRSAECVPLVLLALLAAYTLVAQHEEQGLRALFGSPYEQYCAAVRRWLPRFPPYASERHSVPVHWREVVRIERLFLLGGAAILTATILAFCELPLLTKPRLALLEARPLIASMAPLALACWLVLKIAAVRPLKRAWKQRSRVRSSHEL
jgi:protein-S-isoprenylcysteine O-methyltransferase Ste14